MPFEKKIQYSIRVRFQKYPPHRLNHSHHLSLTDSIIKELNHVNGMLFLHFDFERIIIAWQFVAMRM